MAQGTGDKRFLEQPGKATSARIPLALVVVAALLLAGCGGSSSGEGSSAQSSSGQGTSGAGSESAAGSTTTEAGRSEKPKRIPRWRLRRGEFYQEGSGSGAVGSQGAGAKRGQHPVVIPEGEPEPKITAKQREEATVVTMSLQSPAVLTTTGSVGQLPSSIYLRRRQQLAGGAALERGAVWHQRARSLCDERAAGRRQTFLRLGRYGARARSRRDRSWEAAKGRDRRAQQLRQDRLLDLPSEQSETYIFALFALPEKILPQQGFDPGEMRKRCLGYRATLDS